MPSITGGSLSGGGGGAGRTGAGAIFFGTGAGFGFEEHPAQPSISAKALTMQLLRKSFTRDRRDMCRDF
jgi:hypothetical protein